MRTYQLTLTRVPAGNTEPGLTYDKIRLIKTIRAITGLGLKEARYMTEGSLPVTIKVYQERDDALAAMRTIRESGADAEIIPCTQRTPRRAYAAEAVRALSCLLSDSPSLPLPMTRFLLQMATDHPYAFVQAYKKSL